MTIKWLKTEDDKWTLIYKDKTKKADTLEKLFVWTFVLNVSLDEIERALLEMHQNNHNYAEFGGIKRSFIFSEKR